MTIDSDDAGEPDSLDFLEVSLTPDNHRVLDKPPIPFTVDDLRAALRLSAAGGANAAMEGALIEQLETPDGSWDSQTVMLVALLSPDHARRAGTYLHMAPQMLEQELETLRRRRGAS